MGDTLTMVLPTPNTTLLAFDALYRSCVDDVYAYTSSLLRDRAAAEDVTARAFERGHQGAPRRHQAPGGLRLMPRTDITGSFVSVVDRLRDARAEQGALRRALGAAKSSEGIARLRERIRANRGEVASLNGQLAGLRRRADSTVLSVTVTGRRAGPSGQGTGGGSWSVRDGARDALRVLEVAFGALLVALAIALALGLVALPLSLGARVARRRRREHALDAS